MSDEFFTCFSASINIYNCALFSLIQWCTIEMIINCKTTFEYFLQTLLSKKCYFLYIARWTVDLNLKDKTAKLLGEI